MMANIIWTGAFISNGIAELFFQIGANAFIWTTWPRHKDNSQASSIGWILGLMLSGNVLALLGVIAIVLHLRERQKWGTVGNKDPRRLFLLVLIVFIMCGPSYATSWVFFNIFMRHAGYL
jgi:nicotinamide riboside transporter PnuC